MHCCEHSLPLSMAQYLNLPAENGIIPDHVLDAAYTCGRPAAIKQDGMWLCAGHYDAVERGECLSEVATD